MNEGFVYAEGGTGAGEAGHPRPVEGKGPAECKLFAPANDAADSGKGRSEARSASGVLSRPRFRPAQNPPTGTFSGPGGAKTC